MISLRCFSLLKENILLTFCDSDSVNKLFKSFAVTWLSFRWFRKVNRSDALELSALISLELTENVHSLIYKIMYFSKSKSRAVIILCKVSVFE